MVEFVREHANVWIQFLSERNEAGKNRCFCVKISEMRERHLVPLTRGLTRNQWARCRARRCFSAPLRRAFRLRRAARRVCFTAGRGRHIFFAVLGRLTHFDGFILGCWEIALAQRITAWRWAQSNSNVISRQSESCTGSLVFYCAIHDQRPTCKGCWRFVRHCCACHSSTCRRWLFSSVRGSSGKQCSQ